MKIMRIPGQLLVGVALVAGAASCAPRDEAVATTEDELIGGFAATSARLNAVGALALPNPLGGLTPFCGGTLISPTVVLTAKHCVASVDPAQLRFLVGPNAFAPVHVLAVRGVAVEPIVPTGGLIDFGSDVGVVHLTAPAPGVTPLPFAALTNDRIGSRLVALGYGVQNTDLTFGTRRSGSMLFRAHGGSVFAAIFGTFDNFLANGAARLFPDLDPSDPAQLAILQQEFDNTLMLDGLEAWFGAGAGDAQACTGDGGGPITARVGTQTVVMGVSSWGFGENETCTLDGSAYASLNPISLDFLDYELNCPLVPRAGTCESLNVALRCGNVNEGGRRELRTDCSELGLICGFDENNEIGCVEDPCEGLPPEGVCDGDVATRCSRPDEGDRRVIATDCAAQGQVCALEGDAVTCVTPAPTCAHDKCVTGPALDANCDSCVAQICAVDSFCCNSFWDSLCVAEVSSVCGQACFAGDDGGVSPLRP